ncbi:MAG: zinc ribbon domain-containing protein [Chloroflexi bacterium]|nr:zinc ribbon domain-containing protein [Chloroflexota bacterium]
MCPTCSGENLADALFCAGCRAPLSFACSNCGRDLARDASCCDRCGTPVSGDAATEPASAEETAAPGHRTHHPTSFGNGRYQVKDFLGEGGKKRVYRAHDSVLNRDIALAVIKTEGLDPTSRVRITREAQAHGQTRRPSPRPLHSRPRGGQRPALHGPAPRQDRHPGGPYRLSGRRRAGSRVVAAEGAGREQRRVRVRGGTRRGAKGDTGSHHVFGVRWRDRA